MFTPQEYERICNHFRELVSLKVAERKTELELLFEHDSNLASEVERMLEADELARHNEFLSISPGVEATRDFSTEFVKDSDDSLPSPSSIRGYKVIEKLGVGGMGVVYRAYDPSGDRHVALKIIRSGELSSAEQIKRFQSEAKAAASLQHAHIVPVYEVGREGSCDFFTMALVEGDNLQSRIRAGRLESKEAAELVVKLGRAIEYAHSKGIIHRDIKPSNVMLDSSGEPQLMDFGLAKRISAAESETLTGQILGSVGYMAPEQIDDSKRVGPATDVYGLGATLYECITGQPPFSGDTVVQILTEARTRLPAAPREVCPSIDRDLESICMRCLQKAPSDRYQTAELLVQDLERFIRGEPIEEDHTAWWRSVRRVLRFREQGADLPSASAMKWIFLLSITVHPLVFLVTWTNQSPVFLWAIILAWTVTTGVVNYYYHWSRYWRLASSERLSGLLMLATNISLICLFLMHGPRNLHDPIDDFLDVYPPYCLLIAMGIFAHGSIHSGRWIVIGSLYFPMAIIIHWQRDWGPLIFAIVSTLVAALIDRELSKSGPMSKYASDAAQPQHSDAN